MASERVTVRGPEVCGRCGGDGWVVVILAEHLIVDAPCPGCSCCVCGTSIDVINGECGDCFDTDDARHSSLMDGIGE